MTLRGNKENVIVRWRFNFRFEHAQNGLRDCEKKTSPVKYSHLTARAVCRALCHKLSISLSVPNVEFLSIVSVMSLESSCCEVDLKMEPPEHVRASRKRRSASFRFIRPKGDLKRELMARSR